MSDVDKMVRVGEVCDALRHDAILPAEFYRSMGPNFEQIIADALQQARDEALSGFVEQILHGDEPHRQWLRDACADFKAGRPVRALKGKPADKEPT